MLRNAFDRQGNYRSRAADFDSRPKMAPPQLLREREMDDPQNESVKK